MTETLIEAKIRRATMMDLLAIVDMGRKFLAEGPYQNQLDNPDQAMGFAASLIQNPKAGVFVADDGERLVGVIAFAIFNHFFTGDLTGTEFIWYVRPEARPGGVALQLLWEAEKQAKEAGVKVMQFTAPTVEVGKLYERFGYKQIEIAYEKRL